MSGLDSRKYKKQDSALKIMDALSGVDEELLERSAAGRCVRKNIWLHGGTAGGKKPIWQYGRTWAAVFCLAAAGIMTWGGYQYLEGDRSASGGSSGSAAGYNSAGAANVTEGGLGQSNGAGQEENAGKGTTSGSISDPESAESTNQATPLTEAAAGQETQQTIPESSTGQGAAQTIPESSAGQGAAQTAPEGSAGQGTVQTAPEGSLGQEMQQTVPEGDRQQSVPQDGSGDNGNGMDGTAIDEFCGVPAASWENLTEEEARGKEPAGAYIPSSIPRGYSFESARWSPEDSRLSVGWSRGLDYIELSLRVPDEDIDTVDIGLPETYDARLYEIPYGESVPREYREIFDNPVFAWEDMSLDIVKCRMVSRQDSGDTATPRGNFSVLFSDGVLVRFSGRGTAEQIWEMFCSMGMVE